MERDRRSTVHVIARSAAALAGAVALIAAAGARAPQDAAATVEMTNQLTFTPDSVVIGVGETVEFRNTSALVHTVTADPSKASLDASVALPEGAEPFDSGRLEPDGSYSHTFETAGTYRYFCVPHEGAEMRGVVVVEKGGEATHEQDGDVR